jgi:hypothetical protein
MNLVQSCLDQKTWTMCIYIFILLYLHHKKIFDLWLVSRDGNFPYGDGSPWRPVLNWVGMVTKIPPWGYRARPETLARRGVGINFSCGTPQRPENSKGLSYYQPYSTIRHVATIIYKQNISWNPNTIHSYHPSASSYPRSCLRLPAPPPLRKRRADEHHPSASDEHHAINGKPSVHNPCWFLHPRCQLPSPARHCQQHACSVATPMQILWPSASSN